jgi:adenylate cyclase
MRQLKIALTAADTPGGITPLSAIFTGEGGLISYAQPMATGVACPACGTELRDHARFCDECGAPVTQAANVAEYKQVTVLFADVVRSMDIAAAVGPERLREIMSDLFDRCSEVVQQYGSTLDKFTGDGAMAIFGAPVSLEDHAIRACVAALDVQKQVRDLAVDVQQRDGIDLAPRVWLNFGEVIAGEVGSRAHSYTTIGDQVGMAQRMESVAPTGGVMTSRSGPRVSSTASSWRSNPNPTEAAG